MKKMMFKKLPLIMLILISSRFVATAQYTEACVNCDKVLLTEDNLIDSDIWSVMRNEIYAKHGYIFTNKNWTEYFVAAPWYSKPTKKDVTKELNAIEKQNVALLMKLEKEGFSGFEAFLATFRAAVLSNNQTQLKAMCVEEMYNAPIFLTKDAAYPNIRNAFDKGLWKKSVIASDKTTELDGLKSCSLQFYFTKKRVNGKAQWRLVNIVAPG